MAFSRYTITDAGRELLLSCMASGDFRIEKLVLGSGEYSGDMAQIGGVVAPVLEFSGEALVVDRRESQLELRCRLSNEQLQQGFEWREYGVYATDGAQTVLYCYDNAGDEPVPITAASDGAGISNTIKILMTVDSAATVNVSFQPAPDFVVDDAVTEDGENAVTGAAVWSFVEGYVGERFPTPSAADAGKVIKVQENGTYKLAEVSASMVTAGTFAGQVKANTEAMAVVSVAQLRDIVMTTTDPGAGAAVDYPDGTVIHVYE